MVFGLHCEETFITSNSQLIQKSALEGDDHYMRENIDTGWQRLVREINCELPGD